LTKTAKFAGVAAGVCPADAPAVPASAAAHATARIEWNEDMPQHSTTVSLDAYGAARHRAAFAARSDRGLIVVSGADRAAYLQGLLTNDVASLAAGAGVYAAYLTPQGRMITDLFVYELGDVMLVTVARAETEAVLSRFDQFLFGEDVKLGNVTDAFAHVSVVGPHAAEVVAGAIGDSAARGALDSLAEHGSARLTFRGQPAIVTRETDAGEPGFGVYIDRTLADAFTSSLRASDVAELDAQTLDALRVEAGVPWFGRDMDGETIPLEAGIESRAISFTKGCYVGQEVIIRVLHRGHGKVARKLASLVLDGDDVPRAGAAVTSGDREVGSVTSAAWSPRAGHAIALAYLHRDFLAPGTAVAVEGAAATVVTPPI